MGASLAEISDHTEQSEVSTVVLAKNGLQETWMGMDAEGQANALDFLGARTGQR